MKIQHCITGINYILKYIKMENSFEVVIIFYNIIVLLYIYQINAAFVSIRDLFKKKKKKKNLTGNYFNNI